MTTRPVRMAVLALALSLLVGGVVGGLSQLTAVSTDDPRPSVRPSTTPLLLPTATPAPTATPTAEATPSPTTAPTATPEPRDEVWLYTVEPGESVSAVAVRFGTTTDELFALNPEYADNPDLVEAGAQMIVPCTPIAATEDRC